MVFPGAGGAPRHPSQLYEAGLEGLLLFLLLLFLHRRSVPRGVVMFSFIAGYGLCRLAVEFSANRMPISVFFRAMSRWGSCCQLR